MACPARAVLLMRHARVIDVVEDDLQSVAKAEHMVLSTGPGGAQSVRLPGVRQPGMRYTASGVLQTPPLG